MSEIPKFNGEEANWEAPETIEELDPDGLTKEEREAADYWLSMYEEDENSIVELRFCELEIGQLEHMFEIYESEYTHSLPELHAILELDPKDAPNHPVREPARKDLAPIVALLNTLKNETNITPEEHEKLNDRYLILSKAVGVINNGKVRH